MKYIEELKKIYSNKKNLTKIWMANADRKYKVETSETYYIGEQSITIIRIPKQKDISFYDGYMLCLQNEILIDHEFSKKDIKFEKEKEFYIFYERILLRYIEVYEPKNIINEEFLKRVKFDYNECLREYDFRLSTNKSVRSMMDKYIIKKEILNGTQLVDLWNEAEYFIETHNNYLLYNWNTSA